VIKKLEEGKHVPYRDSKLTRIVANSLGGNAVSAILCSISPALMNYQNTISTLRFASRAKHVKNRPRVNELLSPDESLQSSKHEVIRLKEELAFTRSELEKMVTQYRDAISQQPPPPPPPPPPITEIPPDYYELRRENEILRS
jgi:hypothetical protein